MNVNESRSRTMADLDGKLELCLDNSANCNTSTNTKLMLVLKTRFCWTQDGRRQRCSSKGVYCLIRNTKNVLKTQGVRVWLWAPEAGRKGTVKTDRQELQQTTLENLFSLVARQDWLYLVRWNCLAKESLFYGGGDW